MDLSEDALRNIVAHVAHLRAAYGDVLADAELVEPNGEFFPDEFTLDPAGVERVVRRMLTYAPLSEDLDVELAFVEPEGEASGGGGGCGSGACGTASKDGSKQIARAQAAIETPDGYAVVLHTADVGEPTIMTSAIARSVGRLVLFEADEKVDARDEGPLSELTAISCGLGVLLLNGACVYKKGCGGMRKHQATFLDLEEIAFALALFVRMNDKKAGAVRRHLEVTQREAFDAALAWVDAQPKLVRTLVSAPETLEDGVFALEGKKGIFARLFSRRDTSDLDPVSVPAAPRAARVRTDEELRRIAEAKALVEEALQDG